MKRMFSTVWFRIVALVVTVFLQIGIYVALFSFFSDYGTWFFLFCTVLSAAAVMRIVLKDGCPEYKIAWIIPIMLFPIFGGGLYLIFGHKILSKRERRRISSISGRLKAGSTVESSLDTLESVSRTAAFQARYLENYANATLYDGTDVQYFSVGEEMFESLLLDLKSAKHFIFLEYFIISEGKMWSSILSVLEQKVKEGVDVRLMYDDLGCVFLLPGDFPQQMERKGIQCCPFNRFRHIFNSRFNNRDHRKICVIDGNIGYTGGINLSDEYINHVKKHGHWKDTAIRLHGKGVFGLTKMFLSVWEFYRGVTTDFLQYKPTEPVSAKGFVQPFGSSPDSPETVGENMYINFFNKARNYVYITTPYLIIDNNMINALCIAAKSGVDVRLVTPGIPDKKIVYFLTRSYYRVLLESNVKIYEYTPGFIHAKSAVSDDSTAVVGTINLDYRSLYLHQECAVWMHGTDCVKDVRDDFLKTQEKSREVTVDSIKKMSPWQRMFLSFLRIFAPLM